MKTSDELYYILSAPYALPRDYMSQEKTCLLAFPLMPIIILMVIALYRKGFKKLKNHSRLIRGTTLRAMSGVTAILIHSIVDFNLHITSNTLLFTVLVALVVAPLP